MFLVDANVLIQAKNQYYAFDIAPGFWAWLDQAFRHDAVCSIVAVREELLAGDDELATWAGRHRDFFEPIDQGTTRHFAALTSWANSRDFTPAARSSFTGNDADYLLVAYAMEHQHRVVTLERPTPNARKRIRIPDACAAMEVPVADTFTMLREAGARLDLRGHHGTPDRDSSPVIPGLDPT